MMKHPLRWLYIAAAFAWSAAICSATLAFADAAKHGWSAGIGVNLLVDGATLAAAALSVVYMRSSWRMLENYKKSMAEMAESVPPMLLDMLRDMQQQGIIPPNVEFTDFKPGSKPPGDKLN